MNVLPFWSVAFYTECELQEQGKQLDYHLEKTPQVIDRHYFWEVNGRPVSMCNCREVSSDCLNVSGVYTPPTERGKRYAYAVVWSLWNKFKDKYADIMLYANANYPQSNKCYQRIGFKPLFVNSQYVFE